MSSFTRSTLQLIYDQSLPLGVTTVHLPSFSQIFPDFPSSGLLYVLSFLTILAILFRTFPRRKPNATETCTILRNLQKIITPTQSIWYPEYVKLAERASLSRSKTLTLPLDRLITDVIGGRTEFRDAALHLPDLLLQSAQRSESPVLIGVRMSAWYRVVTWMFTARSNRFLRFVVTPTLTHLPSHLTSALPQLCATEDYVTTPANPSDPGVPSSPSQRDYNTHPMTFANNIIIDLDFVPFANLETIIRTLQTTLTKTQTATINFTTPGPSVQPWSKSLVLTAIPMLPRKYRASLPAHTHVPNVKSTPLRIHLHQVIELVTSGTTPLTVCSVRNVSDRRADQLHSLAQNLKDDPSVRSDFAEAHGMEGWREEMLLTTWEASLYKVAFLTRWAVLVRK